MEDFFQGEFRVDPVPDNVIAVAKTDPFYTITAIERFQANQFFTTTERSAGSCIGHQTPWAFWRTDFL